tara:strand:+ start:433 stop:987 length:555 start_codon:yes stop_codon:yes gene_type:complete
MKQREKILSNAEGLVLEIGFGSGLNLEFYDKGKIKKILALEPSLEMQKLAKKQIEKSSIDIEFLTSYAENIPLKDNSINTVVCTYTLCSIINTKSVLLEIRRVLKKGGKLLISEHVKSPDKKVSIFQKRLNPLWKRIAGGCNINCDTKKKLADVGFNITELNEMYLPNTAKFIGYNIWGALENN